MATCLLALPSVSKSVKRVGWLIPPHRHSLPPLFPFQGFFKQDLNLPPGPLQNGRASDCVHLRQALCRAVLAGTLLWLTHLRVGSVWEAERRREPLLVQGRTQGSGQPRPPGSQPKVPPHQRLGLVARKSRSPHEATEALEGPMH